MAGVTERITKGTTPTTLGFKYTEEGVRFVKVESLEAFRVRHDRCAHISIDADAELKRSRLEANDVLFSIAGTLGRVAVVSAEDLPANTNQAVAIARPTAAIQPAFFAIALHYGTTIGHAVRGGRGVGLQNLNLQQLSEVQLDLPPLNEQRRIVAKLEALQARSRRAREALDAVPPLLEKLRQSILAAAFRGDLTKDWRAQNPNPPEPASALLARIRTERRKKWEESELAKLKAKGKPPTDDRWKAKYKDPEPVDTAGLPELPEGWCWTTFKTVAEVDLGRQRAPQYQTGRHSHPYLRVANIKDGYVDFSDVLSMDFDEVDFAHYQLLAGDILLSEGQSPELVGQSAIYDGSVNGLCFQKTLHRFRAYPSGPSPQYSQLLFRHYVRSGVFRSVSSLTVNIAHLTLVRLKPLHFPLPPKDEERELVRRLQAVMGRVKKLEGVASSLDDQNHTLDRVLLAKAFRGELVPQDPNDEPADVMLSRLRAEATPDSARGRPRRSKAAE